MRLSFTIYALFISLGLHLAKGEQADTRTCRIVYLSAPPDAPKALQMFDGESCHEVELPRMNLSRIYTLRPGALTLSMLAEPATDPLTVPEGVPSALVPESFQHIYLVIRHDPANKVVPVKMAVINANYGRIGRGEMLWVNYSKSSVSGTIGSKELESQPGDEDLVGEPAAGRESYPVELSFQAPGKKISSPLFESRWRHDPRSRSIVFIVADGDLTAPRVLTYSDYREQVDQGDGD